MAVLSPFSFIARFTSRLWKNPAAPYLGAIALWSACSAECLPSPFNPMRPSPSCSGLRLALLRVDRRNPSATAPSLALAHQAFRREPDRGLEPRLPCRRPYCVGASSNDSCHRVVASALRWRLDPDTRSESFAGSIPAASIIPANGGFPVGAIPIGHVWPSFSALSAVSRSVVSRWA
jgi:hypothetical protein